MPKEIQSPDPSSSSAPRKETEIKLRVSDVPAFRRRLKRLAAKVLPRPAAAKDGRAHELNTLYDTPQGGFARHGQLLRIRVESPAGAAGKRSVPVRALLTYKGPAETGATSGSPAPRHKTREEIETEVSNPAAMGSILEALGLRGWFRYEKFRTTFQLPAKLSWAAGLLIELDETPIGSFLELEGPAAAIDRAARELGFARSDYVTKSYLALHVESCQRQGRNIPQLAPGIVSGIPDMLFSVEKKSL